MSRIVIEPQRVVRKTVIEVREAGSRPSTIVCVGRCRFRSRRQHGHRLRTVYFLGPDFTKVRESYIALRTNPSTNFSSNWLEFAGAFRRRLARRAPRVDLGEPVDVIRRRAERWDCTRVSCRRRRSLGSVSDEGHRCRRPARSVYASAGVVRWAKPIPPPGRAPALDAGRRARHLRRAWRWPGESTARPCGYPQRVRVWSGPRTPRPDVDVHPRRSAVRTAAGAGGADMSCTKSTATNS